MDEFEFVRSRLRDLGRSQWDGVAAATGVPVKTIQRIAYDPSANPTIASFLPLLKHLRAEEAA
jgi:hypothetical protein